LLHFLAIQLIHFKPIKPFKNQFSQIEVILTNSKDDHQEDADVLAQSNSNKGGNTEKDAHKKTPLPMITENKNTFQLNNRGDQSAVGKASSPSEEKIVKKDAQVLNEPKAVQQPKVKLVHQTQLFQIKSLILRNNLDENILVLAPKNINMRFMQKHGGKK
jgi:hypothetical protein